MNVVLTKLIPAHLKQDALCYSSAKNVVGGAFIALLAAPFFALVYYHFGFPSAALFILAEGLFISFAAFSLQFSGSLFLTRELIISSLFGTLAWLSYHLGGMHSPTIYWLILPPLLSIFFGGRSKGLCWGALCLSTVIFFYWLPLSPILGHRQNALMAISLGGLIVIILGLAYLFEQGKKAAAYDLQKMNRALKLAKEQAEQSAKTAEVASRLKTEFLANMSHELRTPLNGIIGFTELIYSGKAGPLAAEHREYLGDVLTSAHHLLQLINDILDLSKIESGKMVFQPERINFKVLTLEVKEILSTLIDQKQLQFALELDNKLTTIFLDPRKLKQVIYNYLSNAIKFSPLRGQITIRIFPLDAHFFKLEVSDTGIGIRNEDLPRLFTKFLQLDSGTTKKYQGTGLGLALTQHIVEAQGGSVGVVSEFGKGSTFFAILPANASEILA